MNHLNLSCEIYKAGTSTSLDSHISCLQIRDPFTYGYGIGFNMDSKKETERHCSYLDNLLRHSRTLSRVLTFQHLRLWKLLCLMNVMIR